MAEGNMGQDIGVGGEAPPATISAASSSQADTSPPPGAEPTAPPQAWVLGDVVMLLTASPLHKHLFLADLEWLILPPLMLGQCRLIRREGRPFAFVSWAFLDSEAEERMAAGNVRLRPSDWKAGEAAWIIDVVAPFGGADVALREVREWALSGRAVKALQPAPDGKGMAVVEW